MLRPLRLILVAFLLVLGAAPNAMAKSWWGWLEEFSGPGPFRVRGPFQALHATFVCRFEEKLTLPTFRVIERLVPRTTTLAESETQPSLTAYTEQLIGRGLQGFGTPIPAATHDSETLKLFPNLTNPAEWRRSRDRKYCLYLDYAGYFVDQDPEQGYPDIRAYKLDFGVSYFIGDHVDIGFAGGLLHFDPEDATGVTRGTFTPLRVQIRPVGLFIDPDGLQRRSARTWARLAQIPKLYFKETAILKSIRASDFGAPEPVGAAALASEFRTGPELVASYGVVFDVGEIIAVIKYRD